MPKILRAVADRLRTLFAAGADIDFASGFVVRTAEPAEKPSRKSDECTGERRAAPADERRQRTGQVDG